MSWSWWSTMGSLHLNRNYPETERSQFNGIINPAFDVFIDLANEDGFVAAQFVDAEEFARAFAVAEERHDWIADADLLDVLA